MRNILLPLFIILVVFSTQAQITLTHNVGTTPIETGMFTCEDRNEGWSKIFKLSDFGISPNEQFFIKSLQVALSESNTGAHLQFSVYSIDENFPVFFHSLYPRTVLGTRGYGQAPLINGAPEIIDVYFEEAIVVPAGTERILVTVHKIVDFYNPESAKVVVAGTAEDTGESWYHGCDENYSLTRVSELNNPVPNANFYINVKGEKKNILESGANTVLTHNICDDVVETSIFSCTSSYLYWARDFVLSDFGISVDEEYTITQGQVGINKTGYTPTIQFNIYKIDDNFPDSFSELDLLGSSQEISINPNIGRSSQIINVDFDTPVVVPSGVKKILVEVFKGIEYGDGVAFIAGSLVDDGSTSWYRGCGSGSPGYSNSSYISMIDPSFPKAGGYPDANFYINVTGNVRNILVPFSMEITNNCSDFFKGFSLTNIVDIASVNWDFGDPNSGIENQSAKLNPTHDFSENGTYTISAHVVSTSGNLYFIQETIDVLEPPYVYELNDLEACEDIFGSGISSSFNTSGIHAQIVNGRDNIVVSYFDGNGRELPSPLPNILANSVAELETISVQLSYENQPCCYSETTFDLIVNPLPEITNIQNLEICDDDSDGFAHFDLEQVRLDIVGNQSNLEVEFYHQNGDPITTPLSLVQNSIKDRETITIRALNTNSDCIAESTFYIIVYPLPIANPLTELIGCDDNNDGISEYFDVSNVESEVLNGQTGMEVTYYDSLGNPISLSNPYTNSIPNQEFITVRVVNTETLCFSETILTLNTSSKPNINQIEPLYACDEGNGLSYFDTSEIENQLIGSQTGLQIIYSDADGNILPSPLPELFQNTVPWVQTINVRVENEFNDLCYSETSFDLVVDELPEINLESEFFLCDLEPTLELEVFDRFNSYEWVYEDGTLISNTSRASISAEGNYTLEVEELKNGKLCLQSHTFKLIRSDLPVIEDIRYEGLSANNFVEIMVSGDGDFEYSIDGFNFQNDNLFEGLRGGIYTVFVRDKKGCGQDSKDVTIIDYPKFFTPNDDGQNDYWQILGIQSYPNAIIQIYDRFGKIVHTQTAQDSGWDGYYNGTPMPSSDYWFTVVLETGNEFKGHFSLIRR